MTKEQLEKHKIAARKLWLISSRAFEFIGKNINQVTEYDVNKFILSEFKKEGMVTQKEYPAQIVSFSQNTSFVHYYPSIKGSKVARNDNLVLVDIWAKLNEKDAPYADITWMGYIGQNIPQEIREAFKLVVGAREETIRFLKKKLENKKLPASVELEKAARNYFDKFGVEKYFTHGVGHSLGIVQDHGTYFRFSRKTKSKLRLNIPFTIEPGIYFKNKFGMRSEIDCYIAEDYQLIITTKVQKEIIKINGFGFIKTE